jgi:hypothetical protein
MPHSATARVFAFGALLFLLEIHPAKEQQEAEWMWKDASSKIHSRTELEEILRQHREWLKSQGRSGARADLSGTNLADANLAGARLTIANLSSATLYNANLTDAFLDDANLSGAELVRANLNGANLVAANLTNASLYWADLGRAVFEPKSLPALRGIAEAKNLEFLTYDHSPDALFQLRKQFEDGGFREQERNVTYALKRREAELLLDGCTSRKNGDKTRAILWSSDSNLANCGSFVLNGVFFDLTCQYGMSPGRPLSLGVLVWALCSLLYFVCVHTSGEGGLFRVYAPGIRENPSEERRVERISPTRKVQAGVWRRIFQFFQQEWLMLRASMFFSLMSAFNIGFRDINFGRWLRLLTRQEFDIKAVGWARVVAGWQSLISVYFIALWVLTYFGRPFG